MVDIFEARETSYKSNFNINYTLSFLDDKLNKTPHANCIYPFILKGEQFC